MKSAHRGTESRRNPFRQPHPPDRKGEKYEQEKISRHTSGDESGKAVEEAHPGQLAVICHAGGSRDTDCHL